MRILNFGSLNIDYVYNVPHIVQPGETIASVQLELFCGGKGLNQSVALARAGLQPFHAGTVGVDGGMLLELCEENGIDTRYIRTSDVRTGNAIIQVAQNGENSIVLFGGANRQHEEQYVREVLADFGPGDILLLQNEINHVPLMIELAHAQGVTVALNPSPYDEHLEKCDLAKVDFLFINEVEGEQITGQHKPEEVTGILNKRYPDMHVVLTMGGEGARICYGEHTVHHKAFDVPVVDTTAAGDTFTGYYLYGFSQNLQPYVCLRLASAASAIAVSRKGASTSIPMLDEVLTSLNTLQPIAE